MPEYNFQKTAYRRRRGIFRIFPVLLLAALLFGASGCSYNTDTFYILYFNEDQTGLSAEGYELAGSTLDEMIEELIFELCTDTGSVRNICPIPSGVTVDSWEVEGTALCLDFSAGYAQMETVQEVLCRGAVAQTFLQLPDIESVTFYVEGEPLLNNAGEEIGAMTSDSFVDNPGEEIQYIQEAELTLYFASEDGQSLVEEAQEVYYSSNASSLEQLVVERLLEGPESDGARTAIPEGTQLINVSVLDGMCLVNFDDGFLNYDFEISEDVVIYSIVNSLTALDSVDTVQISVNGETAQVYREQYSLEEQYESDLSLVTEIEEEVQVIDSTEEGGTESE